MLATSSMKRFRQQMIIVNKDGEKKMEKLMDQYSMLVELFRNKYENDPSYKNVTVPGDLMYDVENNFTSKVENPDEIEPAIVVNEADRARPTNNWKLE